MSSLSTAPSLLSAARARRAEQSEGSMADLVQCEPDGPPTDIARDRAAVLGRAVVMLLKEFHQSTWTAFWATVVEGREPAEVAETLGVTRWTIYKARARVLQRLRQELDGLD